MKYSLYPTVERAQRLNQAWLHMLRYYLLFVAVAHLIWETLQLPLYTIWRHGRTGEIAFAVLHCTGGDLLISVATLILALLLAGVSTWPERRFYPVAILPAAGLWWARASTKIKKSKVLA